MPRSARARSVWCRSTDLRASALVQPPQACGDLSHGRVSSNLPQRSASGTPVNVGFWRIAALVRRQLGSGASPFFAGATALVACLHQSSLIQPANEAKGMGESRRRRKQREILHWAQAGRCSGCGSPISTSGRRKARGPEYPTFDHVDPRRLSGPSTIGNGLLKHRRCNAARGGRLPTGCDLIWHWSVLDRMRSAEAVERWGDAVASAWPGGVIPPPELRDPRTSARPRPAKQNAQNAATGSAGPNPADDNIR